MMFLSFLIVKLLKTEITSGYNYFLVSFTLDTNDFLSSRIGQLSRDVGKQKNITSQVSTSLSLSKYTLIPISSYLVSCSTLLDDTCIFVGRSQPQSEIREFKRSLPITPAPITPTFRTYIVSSKLFVFLIKSRYV